MEVVVLLKSLCLTAQPCLPACLFLPACLPATVIQPACLSTCLRVCLCVCLPVCLPPCLPLSLPACLPVCLPPSLSASIPVCVSACVALRFEVPELPVVALYGMDTTLNCSFSHASPFNLSDLSVFWQLTDTKRSVHSYWASQDQLADQGERYANRTSLYPSQLGAGNASLLLRGVRVADEAPYSKPLVTLEPDSNLRPGDEVALTCVAYGGYPEADVLWQDGGGHNLTDNVTTSLVANEEGLFSMRSVLTVTLEPNSTYSCRLTNPLLGEDGHASVTITGSTAAY
ncbi:unnamed protein product [Coregonus sp. 'balchen']|nr:unnamed protein product [Coregonus sp. 'balchen']